MVHLERKRNYLEVYFSDTLLIDIVDMNPGIAVWDYHNKEHIAVKSSDIDSAYREITPYLDKVLKKLLEIDIQRTLDVMRKEVFSKERAKEIDDTIINPPYNAEF
jgi:hypothetical protein